MILPVGYQIEVTQPVDQAWLTRTTGPREEVLSYLLLPQDGSGGVITEPLGVLLSFTIIFCKGRTLIAQGSLPEP